MSDHSGCGWPDEHCDFCWGIEEATCEECGAVVWATHDGYWSHEPTCDYRGGPAIHFEDDGTVRWDYTWEGRPLPDIQQLVLRNQVRASYVPLPELEAWAEAPHA